MQIRVLLTSLALASIPAGNAAAQLFDFTRTQLLRETQVGLLEQSGDAFGYALATGDYNGDGYDDLVVGAPGADVADVPSGVIALYRGSPAGLVPDGYLLEGDAGQLNENGDQFGYALAVLDFNHDGFDDIVVGVPSKGGNAGAIAFWEGSATGIDLSYSEFYLESQVCSNPSESGDRFGGALVAGQLGGAMLFVGATGEDAGAGVFCRVRSGGQGVGGPILNSGILYFQDRIYPDAIEPGDHFGSALAIGHVDGDGVNDLLVGAVDEAPGANPAGGQVTAFYQNTGEGDLLQNGELFDESLASNDTIESGDQFGAAIAASATTPSLVAIGAPGEDASAGAVFLGGFPSAVTRIDESLAGGSVESGDLFGAALAWGDFDHDGFPDLIVGTPGEGTGTHPVTSGVIVAFQGVAGGVGSGNYYEQENLGVAAISQSGDRLGFALAVGDFNGDGRDELAIGAPGDHPNGSVNSGAVYVVPEPAAEFAETSAAVALAACGIARRRTA